MSLKAKEKKQYLLKSEVETYYRTDLKEKET